MKMQAARKENAHRRAYVEQFFECNAAWQEEMARRVAEIDSRQASRRTPGNNHEDEFYRAGRCRPVSDADISAVRKRRRGLSADGHESQSVYGVPGLGTQFVIAGDFWRL